MAPDSRCWWPPFTSCCQSPCHGLEEEIGTTIDLTLATQAGTPTTCAEKPVSVALVVKWFDENQDGCLNLEELCAMRGVAGLPVLTGDEYEKSCISYGVSSTRGFGVAQIESDMGDDVKHIFPLLEARHDLLLTDIFEGLDTNSDGFLNRSELNALKELLELPPLSDDEFAAKCKSYGAQPEVGWALEHFREHIGTHVFSIYTKLQEKAARGADSTLGRGTPASPSGSKKVRGSINELKKSNSMNSAKNDSQKLSLLVDEKMPTSMVQKQSSSTERKSKRTSFGSADGFFALFSTRSTDRNSFTSTTTNRRLSGQPEDKEIIASAPDLLTVASPSSDGDVPERLKSRHSYFMSKSPVIAETPQGLRGSSTSFEESA